MRDLLRDVVSTALLIFGGVVMFAKLSEYNWWLLGSWKGALGVLAVVGLGIMLTNITNLFQLTDPAAVVVFGLWLLAATGVIGSLLSDTTKLEFIWSGAFIGLAWLVQTSRHSWEVTHRHSDTAIHAG